MPKILVIDDSIFQRKIIINILKKDEYNILEAENAHLGLNIIDKDSPDCILLDLLMPEMSGIEFLQALREKNKKIPVIVQTADIQETTKIECIELGAFDVLSKPAKEDILRDTIKRALDSPEEN